MGLKIPDLDDREYADILADARERIPIYAEEWTDHNVHDPGITILETLAWLAESYGYQLDQVTDVHRRKYLKLMGVRPRPPEPATATLELQLPDGAMGTTVPAGETLTAEDPSGRVEVFRTAAPATLTRARIGRVISEHRGGRTDDTRANDTPGMHFLGFGETARPGSAMYLGFDADPFEGVGTLDLAVEFHEADLPEPVVHGDEPVGFEPTAEVVWEYCTDYSKWFLAEAGGGADVWRAFAVRHDGTNHLYGSGTVRLEGPPADWQGVADPEDEVLGQREPLAWVRCRIDRPVGSGAGHEIPPQFDAVAVNTVRVSHGRPVEEEVLARPDGGTETTALPGQTFEFEHGSVLEGPTVDDPEGSATGGLPGSTEGAAVVVGPGDPRGVLDVTWREVEDFDASGSDDRHFVLDRAAGRIRFGDEVRGAVPDAGQRVVARGSVHGGGEAGNIPGASTWRFRRDELVKHGVYTYYSGADPSSGMRGAVVVDDPDGSGDGAAVDYGGWLDDVSGEVETLDARGGLETEVEVEVGSETGDGPAFSPTVVRVDPGTRVRFVWASDGHRVVVANQPAGSSWTGHPVPERAGHEFTHTFEGSVDLSAVTIVPTGPARGGRDAESVDEAFDRLKADMRVPYRAVTLADYGTIAERTPGLRFGRARAFVDAGEDPADCDRRPAVRVVVVPYSFREKPVPSTGFLEAVECHLERHRLLTDRVAVDPPTYVGVGVDVELELLPGYAEAERIAAVDAALREFLHPLEGFDGEGWPFGRPVYQSEIYEVVEGVDGIDCVLDVGLTAFGPEARYRDGNVEIGRTSLVYSEDHDVVVRTGRGGCGVRS